MEKEKVEEYIKKLIELEKTVSALDDDSINPEIDEEFTNELNNVLAKITKDIEVEMESGSNGHTGSSFLEVKVKKLRSDAVIPTYAKEGDAGMDLTITHIISEDDNDINYGYGIAFEIPKGYYGMIISDSITIIENHKELQTKSFKKYVPGEIFGKLIILPQINFKFTI